MSVTQKVENYDGYIYLYPDFPVRADSRSLGECNPTRFYDKTQMNVEEGEPMQQVYVESDNRQGWWADQPIEEIGGDYFPNYLPARVLLFGIEDQIISLNIANHCFRFLCKQSKEKCGKLPFETCLKETMRKITVKPEDHEQFSTLQPFDFEHFRNVTQRVNSNASAGTVAPDLVKKLFLKSNCKILDTSHSQLKNLYQRIAWIGGGGQGAVFKVKNLKNHEVRALKVGRFTRSTLPETLTVVNHLIDSQMTPHLTKTFRHLTLSHKSEDLFKDLEEDDFINDHAEQTNLRQGDVLEMELLDGDLEYKYSELTEMDQNAVYIQAFSARNKLQTMGTQVEDFKPRNFFYKILNSTDTFQGQIIQDFDFWKYTFNEIDFYIPKQSWIVKLGDYDDWRTELFEKQQSNPFNYLESYCKYKGITVDELKAMFPKPKEGSKILEMC